MDTCFLFAKHMDDTSCFFLKLAQDGQLLVPPAQLTFKEIRALQKESKTIIIETTENTLMLSLELSWLPERKARIAIPFALEDQVAQPIEELHFAFDKQRYQDMRYHVTVISKQILQNIMQTLAKHEINYDIITTDWYALSPQELIISESTLLVHQTDFKGALSSDIAEGYINSHPFNPPLLFKDSQISVDPALPVKDELSSVWIAQRIFRTHPVNLCQGIMQHGNETLWIKKGYYCAGALCFVWLLSILLVKILSIHTLNKKNAELDEQIAVIYHQFFPAAQQVISPKFRIQQLLKGSSAGAEAYFWFLLNQLAKATRENQSTIEQLRYQNQTLGVTLKTADFAALERLKNRLSQLRLKVKQTQASTRAQQVVATLELT